MLPTRSKLGSPGSLSKAATPRASKLESPLKSPSSVDRSPKSANKQARSGRAAAPPAQAVDAQDELQKVKELLAQALTDKARAMEELQEVKEKLEDAIAAQRRAQESSELDKFRADELEQAAIDAAQMKEDEWQKELEGVHNQHAIDVSALLAITQELQRVKQEFAMTAEAKNAALSHADDAMKIAEINAEKVGILSSEVGHLKGLLEAKAEAAEALKHELEAAKRAESDAAAAIEEWRKKVDMFEARLASATESERAAVESLSSAMKKLEESEIQISSLQGKAKEMQAEIARNAEDIDEGARRLEMCHQEVGELQSSVEAVKAELRRSEEEKKEAAAELENLAAERRGIEEELEAARDEAEKSKRAMEGLASALHEVSAEARDSQERILMKQAEVEDANEEAERLKMELKTKEESYRLLLSEAKEEIGSLRSALEEKELDPAARRLEDELRALKDDMGELIKKLKAATEEGEELKNRVRKAEEDAGSAMESVEAEKAENLRLKDRLLDKENELQSISQENDDLRAREAAALGRIQSLTKLLTEAESKNGGGVNEGENSEEYDILPKAADIPDDSAAGGQPPEKDEPNESPALQKSEGSGSHPAPPAPKADEPADEEASAWDNCHVDKDSSHQDDPETEALDEGVQPIAEHAKDGASDVVENGNVAASGSPPSKQPLHDPKKKKPLLRKFGNLLKKKSNPK